MVRIPANTETYNTEAMQHFWGVVRWDATADGGQLRSALCDCGPCPGSKGYTKDFVFVLFQVNHLNKPTLYKRSVTALSLSQK